MTDEWWYARGPEKFGPLPLARLRALQNAGAIDDRTLVCRSGAETWEPLGDNREADATPGPAPAASAWPAGMPPLPVAPGPIADAQTARTRAARDAVLALPLAGPWRRFWAKLFDLYFIMLVAGVPAVGAASYFSPGFAAAANAPGSDRLLGLVMTPFALFVETLIFGLTGSTPGKWLLGLRVITMRGERPRFQQYLSRQLGVFWSGFGLGIPLVTLFTMNHQHKRVKGGGNASYDAGRFNVKARPVGGLRVASTAVLSLLLFTGMMALIGYGNEANRAARTPTPWTNPVTGARTTLPAGWSFVPRQRAKETDAEVYVFVQGKTRVQALLASEPISEQYSLEEYLALWSDAVRDAMALKPVGTATIVNGRRVVETHGSMKNEQALDIHATVMRKGGTVWRVLFFGKDGAEESADTRRMREALFGSV